MLDFCNWVQISDEESNFSSDLFGDCSFERSSLPFYKSVYLIRGRSKYENEPYMYFLVYRNRAYELSGPSDNIHEANEVDTVCITEENVIPYIKFFSYFIQADHANFPVIESCDDEDLKPVKEKLPPDVVNQITRMEYLCKNEKNNHVVSGVVKYKDSLFRIKYEVECDGHLEMFDEEMIWELEAE